MNATATPNEPVPSIAPSGSPPERGRATSAARARRWYYALKYAVFRKEQRAADGRRGLVVLQVDALAYADLRRALDQGYCPTLARLLREERFTLRRWFCGLPSATPYCQAGILHGENAGIPAFRFYDKPARRVVTCNAPEGVQYIRDRIRSPGALAGGSSYVNLLDGDAQTVAFTVATRERMSVYRRLGGTRMALLVALHPVRVLRLLVQGAIEWLREEWERTTRELTRRPVTHAEGIFPFLRVFTNVVVRELQTLAVLLDVYLGVPVIYSTFMQYDELAHHFGPASRPALRDLRRTDARVAEIWRMIRSWGRRPYDLVVLSDHGMTPAKSYRVTFGESLGTTVQRILDGLARPSAPALRAIAIAGETSEYAEVGPRAFETMAEAAPPERRALRRGFRGLGHWVRSRYGLRELILPEKYRVGRQHGVVVTYSSCLAHLYFADDPRQLELTDVAADGRRSRLYAALLAHPGIGLLLSRRGAAVHAESRRGRAVIVDGACDVLAGENPLDAYGTEPHELRAVEALVRQWNAGDLVLFGAYDGYDIVSFDDQVGAHGSLGGDQAYPFLVAPTRLGLDHVRLEDARDLHAVLMARYAAAPASSPASPASPAAPPAAPAPGPSTAPDAA